MAGGKMTKLVNLSEVLAKARTGKYAVGSFNVYNYETIRGVIEAGKETGFPTIVAFGENYLKNMDCDEVASLVSAMARKVNFPVVLHLDHCKSIDTIRSSLDAGFSSVMYDGSALSFEENIRKTAEVVSLSHAKGASVEAELGALAKGEFSNEESAREIYTNPEQADRFVRDTGIDALAVSIGTVHGMYKGTPKIDIGVLKQIASATDVPLVLHGGSGTPEEIVKECIRNGIAKINVNTEISVHALEKMKELFNDGGGLHLSQLGLKEVTFVKEVVLKYMKMFRTL
jgi:ketose-bisphosphate aldolase